MWIRDVDVPDELIQAARGGRLVLFVGAGASMDPPANLPDFDDLVTEVGTRAGRAPNAEQLKRPDVFLGDLVDEKVGVHSLVAKVLDVPGSEPNMLHRAIVDLARHHPPVRIVTTNYDRHLATAARDAGLDVETFRGPALPVGDDFEGMVQLHGSLDQEPRRLIVTDKDFGHAYLREAWAARFLERMYTKYTVLFIGYSHGDVVMQYLARSLGSEHPRFVLTDDKDRPAWRRLGITPVSYQVTNGSHAAVTATLARWAELAALGSTGHRRLISDIVAAGVPTIPDEISYIEDSLTDPERIRYFVEAARGADWLTWVAVRSEFATLLAGGPNGTAAGRPVSPEVTAALAGWLAEHYVMVETASPAALRVMRDKAWTPATQWVIARQLFAADGRTPDWQIPWLVLVLGQTPPARNDVLDMLMRKEGWRERLDAALLLLEHRTHPVARPGIDFGEINEAPYFSVDLVGEEYWLTQTWENVFMPELATPTHDDAIARIAAVVESQLRNTYRLLRSLYPGSEAISFGRSAIEPHPQDEFREAIDVLIDANRDCLECLITRAPATAAAKIESWVATDQALFRRLAVHGYRRRPEVPSDDKLSWVCGHELLYDLDAQHEVFVLLEDAVPSASAGRVQALLEHVAAGPPTDDEDPSPYRRYNLLAWLARVASASEPIQEAFAADQEAHPEFEPREHPDLNMYMTETSFEDEGDPFTVEQLHAMIASDARRAWGRIRFYHRDQDLFSPDTASWEAALRSVRACVTAYPDDGLRLSEVLNDTGETGVVDQAGKIRATVYETLIDAWGDADLIYDAQNAGESVPENHLVKSVVDAIAGWPVDQIRNHATRMLAYGDAGTHPTQWHQHQAARELAATLWPDREVTGNVDASDDLHLAAINHPCGQLSHFWTKAISHDWAQDRADWTGLPRDHCERLELMLNAPGRNGRFVGTILGGHLHFYFSADRTWTSTYLLPQFNWETDTATDAQAVWQGFLHSGRYNDGLLDAGLLTYYLQTCTHVSELGGNRDDWRLGAHLASIAMFAAADPATWLPTFVPLAPEQLRVAWARQVGRKLRDLAPDESDQQWSRWIRAYWTDRTDSLPRPFTDEEARVTAEWIFGLPTQREAAVDLVERTSAALDEHGTVLHKVADTDLTSAPHAWTRYLTHLLANTTTPSWAIGHYLKGIVKTLKATDRAPDLTRLVEHAIRLGCTGAGDW